MESTTCKIISDKELHIEIASQRSALDFSQTKKGPGCDGCFSLVFERACGHAYVYRKRCQPRAPVCAGSEILTVQVQNIILEKTNCTICRCLNIESHRGKKGLKRKRHLGPENMAAKMRLEEARERWKRQCLEAEKRLSSQQGRNDPQASHDGKSDEAVGDSIKEEPVSEQAAS